MLCTPRIFKYITRSLNWLIYVMRHVHMSYIILKLEYVMHELTRHNQCGYNLNFCIKSLVLPSCSRLNLKTDVTITFANSRTWVDILSFCPHANCWTRSPGEIERLRFLLLHTLEHLQTEAQSLKEVHFDAKQDSTYCCDDLHKQPTLTSIDLMIPSSLSFCSVT